MKFEDMINKVICGDCLEVMKDIPDNSIDCMVTSPPYWALRDYGVEGQIGLEPTFQEYIEKLITIFDEVKRILKKEGTCFVNIGDTYISKGETRHIGYSDPKNPKVGVKNYIEPSALLQSIPEKCLTQIPSRFAIEMSNHGWILRNEIIWYKRNCMPSSVKDRFTVDFEKVFFFVKSKKYWFEQQYEKNQDSWGRWGKYTNPKMKQIKGAMSGAKEKTKEQVEFESTQGRNKRCVWDIPTKPFPESHFAVFPPTLVEPMIKAGCPQYICSKCGKAREKIYKVVGNQVTESMRIAGCDKEGNYYGKEQKDYDSAKANKPSETKRRILKSMSQIKEFEYSNCGCNSPFKGGIVLDPFAGSGTVGVVAKRMGIKYILIDLNPEYCKMAEERLRKVPERLDNILKEVE